MKKNKPNAFTVMELIVVVVVISALAALAIPRFNTLVMRFQNQEALRVLAAIYSEQIAFNKENGAYATVLSDLDIDIPVPNRFQQVDVSNAGIAIPCGPAIQVAEMVSNSGGYTLYVLDNGEFACCGTVCARLGI